MAVRRILELGFIPLVFCKEYHEARTWDPDGSIRTPIQKKSKCPIWANPDELKNALIQNALFVEGCSVDLFGRPKKIWNAANGIYFIGVSNSSPEPFYNCMIADSPESNVREALGNLVRRTIEDVLDAENDN